MTVIFGKMSSPFAASYKTVASQFAYCCSISWTNKGLGFLDPGKGIESTLPRILACNNALIE